jgi:hypothetical protein
LHALHLRLVLQPDWCVCNFCLWKYTCDELCATGHALGWVSKCTLAPCPRTYGNTARIDAKHSSSQQLRTQAMRPTSTSVSPFSLITSTISTFQSCSMLIGMVLIWLWAAIYRALDSFPYLEVTSSFEGEIFILSGATATGSCIPCQAGTYSTGSGERQHGSNENFPQNIDCCKKAS